MRAIAQQAVVERYREPLLRYCTRFMGRSDAEDIVQLAFERTLPVLRDPKRELLLKPWLYRVTHNLAINQMSLKRAVPSDTLETNGDESPAPEVELEQSARLTGLVKDIKKLPERQRAALLMRDFEGRSYEDVAEALDSNTTNARKLTQLARKRLRDGLGVLLPGPWLSGLWRRFEIWFGKSGTQLAGAASAAAPIAAAVVVLGGGVAVSVETASGKRGDLPAASAQVGPNGSAADVSRTPNTNGTDWSGSPADAVARTGLLPAPGSVEGPGTQGGAATLASSGMAPVSAFAPAAAPAPDTRTPLQQKRDAVAMERAVVRERRADVRLERGSVREQRQHVAAERQALKQERQSLAGTRKQLKADGIDRRSARQQLETQRQRVRDRKRRVADEQRKTHQQQKEVVGRQRDVTRQQKKVHERQREVVQQQRETSKQRNEAAAQRRQAAAQERQAAAQQRQAAAEQKRQAAADQRAQKKAARQGSAAPAPESPQT